MQKWILEKGNRGKFYLLIEGSTDIPLKVFGSYEEAIKESKELKGENEIFDDISGGIINLTDGRITKYETEYRINNRFVAFHWLGEKEKSEEEKEKTRYSIYDVYSQDELL